MSTWTAASSCARGLAQPGLLGGEASRCEPASCCEPAALSCWQIAEWLVGGYAPGRSAAASAHATRGALSGQHSRAAESRVGVLRPSHSSPWAAAVDSSSLTAKVTMVLHHTRDAIKEVLLKKKKEVESYVDRRTNVNEIRLPPSLMVVCEEG